MKPKNKSGFAATRLKQKGFIHHFFPLKKRRYLNIQDIQPNKKNAGFTLIELLVVISIIGLLASVVLVSLNKTRIKARDTRRIADLKQIMTALEMYVSDNGYYPSTYPGSGTNPAWSCFDCWGAVDVPIYNPSNTSVSLGNLTTVMSTYIKNPKDPKNPGYYGSGYLYASDGNNFKLKANRGPEDLRNFPSGMLDPAQCGGIDASTGHCNVAGTSGGIYDTVGFWTNSVSSTW